MQTLTFYNLFAGDLLLRVPEQALLSGQSATRDAAIAPVLASYGTQLSSVQVTESLNFVDWMVILVSGASTVHT